MYHRFSQLFIVALLSLIISACTTSPNAYQSNAQKIAPAIQFVRNIEAGELAMSVMQLEIQNKVKENPESADIMQNALAEIKVQDLENLIAQVYSRHLTDEQLTELASFTEQPTIKRLFQLVFDNFKTESAINPNKIFNQFNSLEQAEIVQMVNSQSFTVLIEKESTIEKDMQREGARLAAVAFLEYLED